MSRPWPSRIAYLISRTILRPERAVSTVSHYYPALDVLSLLILAGIWIGLFRGLTDLRGLIHGMIPVTAFLRTVVMAFLAYGVSLLIIGAYAIAVCVVAVLLGGRARLAATLLAYLLTTAVALAVSTVPVSILRMVNVDGEINRVTGALIDVGPWVYIFILLYSATDRIHKTVLPRVIAYMGLGAMPIILLLVLLWRYLDLPPLIGLV